MKSLVLILSLLAGQAWGAYAANTLGLYDLEQNLSDTAGTRHGTLGGGSSYQVSGVWHGSYSESGNFTVPTSNVASSGTVEFSWRDIAVGTTAIFSISTASTRALELYQSGGVMYAYSSVTGLNSGILGITPNTNYYIKMTWNGSLWNIWAGTWTVAGSSNLSHILTDATAPSMSGPTTVYILRNSAGLTDPGYVDWIRFRDVYDNTATITVDPAPASLVIYPLSPYVSNSNSNRMFPLWNK